MHYHVPAPRARRGDHAPGGPGEPSTHRMEDRMRQAVKDAFWDFSVLGCMRVNCTYILAHASAPVFRLSVRRNLRRQSRRSSDVPVRPVPRSSQGRLLKGAPASRARGKLGGTEGVPPEEDRGVARQKPGLSAPVHAGAASCAKASAQVRPVRGRVRVAPCRAGRRMCDLRQVVLVRSSSRRRPLPQNRHGSWASLQGLQHGDRVLGGLHAPARSGKGVPAGACGGDR